jgi:hypothetical protein
MNKSLLNLKITNTFMSVLSYLFHLRNAFPLEDDAKVRTIRQTNKISLRFTMKNGLFLTQIN